MHPVTAISKARALLRVMAIDAYPVDVEAIAHQQGFQIKFSDQLGPKEAGYVVNVAGKQLIVVNDNDHAHRQRFTIMHEVAHEVLDLPSMHGSTLSQSQLYSYATRPPVEILCDLFAAECLVPWHLIAPLTEEQSFEAATVQQLSEAFEASQSCVASRFAQASRDLHIYVLAENGLIRNVIPSTPAREQQFWIDIGIQLPRSSAADTVLRNGHATGSAGCDGSVWSASRVASQFSCYEEAILQGQWGQTLSLLTLEVVSPDRHLSVCTTAEEDELLPELNGELPWPKR
jgi:hypothetical protein